MDELFEPKSTVFAILNGISSPDFNVYQIRPEVFEDLEEKPSVVFSVGLNTPSYTLDSGIGKQVIEIQIDIFGINSVATGPVLKIVESTMRENGYLMTPGSTDIADPDGYSHLLARFVY